MGMFSIWGSPFPYGDYRTEMGRETRIFPYGESPFPNRVCFNLGININIYAKAGGYRLPFFFRPLFAETSYVGFVLARDLLGIPKKFHD